MNGFSPPTHIGRSVLFFAVTLAIITYVDRVCISQAAPYLQEELGLSAAQMGLAFSAFAWAYALFEIPGGWLGDWIGPRKVLMRVVIMWSLFTAATGYVWNLTSLVIARFLFGAGEAGCFPNLTKAFMIWLPNHQRTRAQVILWLSARWGGAFTPLLVIWVMSWLSWRNTFVLFGMIGMVWAFFFYRSFRPPRPNSLLPQWKSDKSSPSTRPSPSGEGEPLAAVPQFHASRCGDASSRLPLGGGEGARRAEEGANAENPVNRPRVPWRKLLCSRTVWLLWAQYFCLTYGWFFYVTWLPTYLKETRGLELDRNAFMLWLGKALGEFLTPEMSQRVLVAALAGVPLFFGGLGAIFCGLATPHLIRATGSVARTRKMIALIGFTGASVLLVASFYVKDPLLAMLAMGLASFGNDLTMPGSWSACMDVGGKFAGTLSGSMNMMGSIGAAVAPLVIGLVLEYSDRNWAATFWIAGVIYFLGGLCWLWLDPVTPIQT
ncbi:MAG: MFS transporter [Verrucomicrobia bacterium]|nr:MAG: MFS transporter [Verrucomicrobiota bacterium]